MKGLITKKLAWFCWFIIVSNALIGQEQSSDWQPAYGLNFFGTGKAPSIHSHIGFEGTFEYIKRQQMGLLINLVYSNDKELLGSLVSAKNLNSNTILLQGGMCIYGKQSPERATNFKLSLCAGYLISKARGQLYFENPHYSSHSYLQSFRRNLSTPIIELKYARYLSLNERWGFEFGGTTGWSGGYNDDNDLIYGKPTIINHRISPVHFRIIFTLWFFPKG
jgi:hypothetical protein